MCQNVSLGRSSFTGVIKTYCLCSLLSLFTCFAHSRLSRRSSTRNGSEGCPFSCKAEPAGLLPCKQKTLARQHPAAFPPQAYSASRPVAPSPRPPPARANGHRPPHAPRAGWREARSAITIIFLSFFLIIM